jgi:hypothetical protein
MATTTTNFGWDIPQSTDLVKDGATAIAALGQDIDTALIDLKGGTTGQVLAKASGTDLDYSWVTTDDTNAIQNAIVDAKGDLIGATAADTPARLAVGTNGQVLTADSTAGTGLAWATPASGSMTLISTTSLTGSSVVLSSIPQTYNNLYLVVRNFAPATDNVRLNLRFNGVTSGAYNFTGSWTATDAVGFGDTFISISDEADNSATQSLGSMTITDYTNATTFKTILGYYLTMNPTTPTSINNQFTVGYHNNTAAITSITLFAGSGNLSAGTALLYGVK